MSLFWLEWGAALLVGAAGSLALTRILKRSGDRAATKAAPLPGTSASGEEAVDTWDVFDTLIARYCVDPEAVFHLVALNCGFPEFPQWRARAQSELDALASPYDIYDIYRKMRESGLDAAFADRLLAEELSVEREQAVPIRRNIERIGERDLLVSDMYLGADVVSDLVGQVMEAKLIRPPIVGNWGKSGGAIWPALLGKYRIRMHHGDNPHADRAMPARYGIACELTEDHVLTPWEAQLFELGESQLAFLLRECRLRSVPSWGDRNCELFCGELLSLVTIYAAHIERKYRDASAFVFCSRGGDYIAQVFRALFPQRCTVSVDLNRALARLGDYDDAFNRLIPDGALIADVVSTGRSAMGYINRNPAKKLTYHTLFFAEFLLDKALHAERNEEIARGAFNFHFSETGFQGHFWHLERLLQPGYDQVMDLDLEPRSGAVVRCHEPEAWHAEDLRFLKFKAQSMEAFLQGLRARPVDRLLAGGQDAELLRAALINILGDDGIRRSSPTFFQRDVLHMRKLDERFAAAQPASPA